jgi:hypothetical protein
MTDPITTYLAYLSSVLSQCESEYEKNAAKVTAQRALELFCGVGAEEAKRKVEGNQ